jgi:quinol-cytochrome oxidoreductase complex cytochrome b subunit
MATMGEALMLWVAGAATILGVLLLIACNVGNTIGQRADPLRTPGELRPSWPLLPWYAAEEAVPSRVPVAFLLCVAALVLYFWPRLGRGLAERRPALHAALGIATLLLVAALAAMEATR